MRQNFIATCLTASLVLGLGGCNDFLTGDGVPENPNNPTRATDRSLFVAAQTNLTVRMESHLARTLCIWMQQCAGISQQYLSVGTYSVGEDEFYDEWAGIYGQGGLLDLRRIQAATRQRGDSTFAGIAMVLEAWLVSEAADVWGDVPYSQAGLDSIPEPVVDPQQDVYAALQARLDTAIAFLTAAGSTNFGPTEADLVYGGDPARWRALAHTLKARLHLHTAEQLGDAAYASALAEAQQGIASPADDYVAYHSGEITERNLWQQFSDLWSGYIAAGGFGVSLLRDGADPRLELYYSPNSAGAFVGAEPGDAPDPSEVSFFSATRLAPDFRQPLVTWAESQLIVAEAAYRTGNTALAQSSLDAVRTDAGLAPVGAGASGPPLLEAILTEKYIRLFQNMESWNDYKRTCFPALTPAPGATSIPGRLSWPRSEENANSNIPETNPLFNWNDPNRCA